ncbi:Magnesium and cobalt efflux protein CorC [Acidisarcina polymorpha]|uniref:Magnesium and cobalt efflux protein CorC n=1 Tax=Acidisarcina polymorpha TaxID=2211140 RepID=A0A2Z5FXP0_9BACT|nr:hemolysin family protein [Acidisarcina polymorpha]AXC11659.1 Magnesium and cobalt efflux protein CorC [Acidisarcina polymorpha]
MSIVLALVIVALLFTLTLASYVDRLYSEMGKFLAREFQENIDAWEQRVEPRLGFNRERIALSAAVLTQLSLACLTLLFGAMLFDRSSITDRPTIGEIGQVVLGVVMVIVLFNRLLPFVFFTRTRGLWMIRFRFILRLLFLIVAPVTFLLSFLLSIAALAETPQAQEADDSSEAVDALIEAGEEEGIIEKGDRDLVRSAVEFGDKVVSEVMTPRPQLFAVPDTLTIEEFLQELNQHPYSRVPVYHETIDQVTGIAFSHDLLQIPDTVAGTRTVASIQRPAAFVPETKKVNELLREMQRAKQHMRIVIDEYGSVAGVVTIEDLLEELVGNITDEHEEDAEKDEPVHEQDGSWTVPGSLNVERLEELFGETWQMPEDYEATTVAGLVSETAGRIPSAGEVVEDDHLRFEVLASTDRRIERVRVSRRTVG